MTNLESILKSRDINLLTKVHLVKAMVFPVAGYITVQMWELDHKGWTPKNWCFWIAVLGKTFESPLEGDQTSQSWRKSNLNIHWKDWCWSWSWSSNILSTWCKEPTHWKDPDAGKDWRQEEKGATEDEMVGWYYWPKGHEFEQLCKIVKDRETWCAAVHGVTKSWTWLSEWTTTRTKKGGGGTIGTLLLSNLRCHCIQVGKDIKHDKHFTIRNLV